MNTGFKSVIFSFMVGLTMTSEALAVAQLIDYQMSPFVVLEAGSIATATVRVSEPCPLGGCVVSMYSASAALRLTNMTIPAGATQASQSVLVGDVASTEFFITQAYLNGSSKYLDIWVNPRITGPVMTSASLNAYLYSSQVLSINMNLSEPCPAEGCQVSLFSSNRSTVALPYNYLIPSGYSSATHSVKVGSVKYTTPLTVGVEYKNFSQDFTVVVFPTLVRATDGSYIMYAYGSSVRTGTGAVTKSQNMAMALNNMKYHYDTWVTKQCQFAIPGGILTKVGSPVGKGEFRNASGALQYEYTQKASCRHP